MRIAIVDDLAADQEGLARSIALWAKDHSIPLVPDPALFASGEALLEKFSPGQYDIIFLDIYMDGMDGMETARRIRAVDTDCRLVFITTTAEFAVESYEVGTSWYLVKPYTQEKLSQALERCGASFLEQGQSLWVPGKNRSERLLLHRIAWSEYGNRKICIHFKDGSQTLVRLRQMEFASMLADYPYFCDCMKGILVNFEAVDKLLDHCFLLEDGTKLPISRLKYREVRERFLEFSYNQTREKNYV